MKTLIELYDERAIENVLGPDMFRPDTIVYVCPEDVLKEGGWKDQIGAFFRHRGYSPELHFIPCSLYKADRIYQSLVQITQTFPDCALDITGGTDAALFASGMLAEKNGTPSFTYSRKKNRFYNILNAPFADAECRVSYKVEDVFLMACGTLRQGRVDNRVLARYADRYSPFMACFLRHRREWTNIVTWFQRASASDQDSAPLQVRSRCAVKGERGSVICADKAALQDFEELGFLHDLSFSPEDEISFTFEDRQCRAWLRDVGSVLELYAWKACMDAGIFGDVISSAVVDWDDAKGKELVRNEIDVMAVRGVTPFFLSCKTCEVKTEALNELAVLRDRFGGKGAKAAILTAEPCGAAARHRAAQLGIAVIDLEELQADQLISRIKTIMKAN